MQRKDSVNTDVNTNTDLNSNTQAIHTLLTDILDFLANHSQYKTIATPFCEHIDTLIKAWTTAGISEEMLIQDLRSVKKILKEPSLENIETLYRLSKTHEEACDSRIKAGSGIATASSLFGPVITYGLTFFGIASNPFSIGIGVTAFITGTLFAGLPIAVDASKKRGHFALLEQDIITVILHEFWENEQYKSFVIATINLERIKIESDVNQDGNETLLVCINKLQNENINENDITSICHELIYAFLNLNTFPSTSSEIKKLIHHLVEKLIEREEYKQYAFIMVNFILNVAALHNQNPVRDKILCELSDKIQQYHFSKNIDDIFNDINVAILLLNKNSKKNNFFGLTTSQSAIQLKEMILDKIPILKNRNSCSH